jgi:hypothetical protein
VTKAEFFQCLRESRDKFLWAIGTGGKIRGISLANPEEHLHTHLFCPITAVCFVKTELRYNVASFKNASNCLKLNLMDVEINGLVNAADQIKGADMVLRHEIEEAVFGKVVTK